MILLIVSLINNISDTQTNNKNIKKNLNDREGCSLDEQPTSYNKVNSTKNKSDYSNSTNKGINRPRTSNNVKNPFLIKRRPELGKSVSNGEISKSIPTLNIPNSKFNTNSRNQKSSLKGKSLYTNSQRNSKHYFKNSKIF